MSKYLFHVSYTEKGLPGLLKEGGSKRREAAEEAIKSVDGSLEALYYAFGGTDVFLIAELPSNASAVGLALKTAATGTIKIKTTVLLTPEEVDEATKKDISYRPPGQ